MFELRQTAAFNDWAARLRDRHAKRRIAQRLLRVRSGHLGDVKYFDGIGEMRIDYGPGYRIYFVRRG
jgi:putative addiction module killer protein